MPGLPRLPLALLTVASAVALAGCGSSSSVTQGEPITTSGGSSSGPGALQAEAASAATGDIPDNQVFLVFHDAAAGWSMKYPEGWAQSGGGMRLTFRDKNNIVRVVVVHGRPPSAASIRRDLAGLAGVHVRSGPAPITLPSGQAFKVVYTTRSPANAVTGKRVTLTVDRYYLAHAGKEAIVDLGTPVGVDNVDAYRLMIESFRWR